MLTQLVNHLRASTSTSVPADSTSSTSLHLLSVLPSQASPATEFISSSLPNADIAQSAIFRPDHQDAASSYILHNSATHSRTIISLNELPELTFKEFKAKVQSHGTEWKKAWFHFEGRIPDVLCQCVQWLRAWSHDVKISLECEKPQRVGLNHVLDVVDVVFFSKIWAQNKGFNNAEDFLHHIMTTRKKPGRLACCTWGAGGAEAVLEGWEYDYQGVDVPAWHPSEGEEVVVDTIGAGDTFIAGMLFALNYRDNEWTLSQKLKFANELAGRKVIQEGFNGLGEKMV